MKTIEFQNVTFFLTEILESFFFLPMTDLTSIFLLTNYLFIIFFSLPLILIQLYLFSGREQLFIVDILHVLIISSFCQHASKLCCPHSLTTGELVFSVNLLLS